MKIKAVFFACLIAVVPALALAQQDEDVRGAFMTTRPKPAPKGTKPVATNRPSHRRPKLVVPEGTKPVDPTPKTSEKLNTARLGLGLTLFMRDSNGLSVRTDPTHQFRKGDHVRFLLETNTDGFLYVFNTTDGGQPIMIYPDPEVDEAGNYFQAHVPFEIPSSMATEERLRWFTFDDRAGAEKLYFVFTREPLGAVPIEDDLITYCRDNDGKCPWRPADDTWAAIQKEMAEPIQIAKSDRMGSAQTAPEKQAVSRGIGLNRDDPEPSLIMLTASTSRNMLVAVVDLIHKSMSAVDTADEEGPVGEEYPK
ncbi:MAG TPA: DUF4384 domain-containing protein [Pyrinomonadaceae bacterium]|jgi:hypothetical protein|nr:DUF4384 domain-containing protein [Pyrinomonadaceae bacterium]